MSAAASTQTPIGEARLEEKCPFCATEAPPRALICTGCGAKKAVAAAGWNPFAAFVWLAVLFAAGAGVFAMAEWGWEKFSRQGALCFELQRMGLDLLTDSCFANRGVIHLLTGNPVSGALGALVTALPAAAALWILIKWTLRMALKPMWFR